MPSERDWKSWASRMGDVSVYSDGYPWVWGRCRWFPWLPRWWWSGIYGPLTPYAPIPKEQEIAMLKNQEKMIEQALEQIRKRLKELKKKE